MIMNNVSIEDYKPMPIPCIDCICLPICKGEMDMPCSGTAVLDHIRNVLLVKCSLLNEYVYFKPIKQISDAVMLFKVKDYFQRDIKGEE